jgi:hypothetical protein
MGHCPGFVPMPVLIVPREKESTRLPTLLLETELALFA